MKENIHIKIYEDGRVKEYHQFEITYPDLLVKRKNYDLLNETVKRNG